MSVILFEGGSGSCGGNSENLMNGNKPCSDEEPIAEHSNARLSEILWRFRYNFDL